MTRQEIVIHTTDGAVRACLFQPSNRSASSRAAGVVLYMDAFEPRPALDAMAERLAGGGYVVLIPDLFYRFGQYEPFDAKTAFANEATRDQLMGMIQATVKT